MGPRDVFLTISQKPLGLESFRQNLVSSKLFFWFWCTLKQKLLKKIPLPPPPLPQFFFKTSAKIQIAIFPTRQCWLLKICKVSNWSQYLRGLLCHLVLLWFCLFCSFHWNVHCIALSGFYLSLLHHIYIIFVYL